jgi:hypothetical protein
MGRSARNAPEGMVSCTVLVLFVFMLLEKVCGRR